MVWINDHMFSHGACQCAWGGVKDSGYGSEGGIEALEAYLNTKSVSVLCD